MSAISLTPEQLQSQAAIYLSAKDQIEQAVQTVNRTNGEWHHNGKGKHLMLTLSNTTSCIHMFKNSRSF